MDARTSVQRFAVIFGIAYTLVGLLGFIPAVLQRPPADSPSLAVDAFYGYLLGVFPVNVLHNLVHIITGLLAIVSAGALSSARVYSRGLAILFGALTVMGLVPGFNTTFGLIPIFGADVALHAVTALVGVYFGWFVAEARTSRARTAAARG
jgi:hypothetical protein